MPTHRNDLTPSELHAALAARVRPVCATLPEPEFDALIARMVEVELRWRDPRYTADVTIAPRAD